MRSATHIHEWWPRRAALMTAAGMWAAGFALFGASEWRIQHDAGRTSTSDATFSSTAPESDTSSDSESADTPADTAETEGAVFMPGDVVVGSATDRRGMTELQGH
jgi:hypothetical protein